MTDINTPEAIVPPGVAPTPEVAPAPAGTENPDPSVQQPQQTPPPVDVTALGVAERAAVDETVRANEAADAAHVNVVVNTSHHIGVSLLHSDSTYVEHLERGIKRIEQIVGR